MLDGAGDVRITDFGLAEVTGSTDQIRAGTLPTWRRSKLAGQPATTQSDLYALGLLLFEIFTGRRAFMGDDQRVVRQQQQFDTAGTRPSAIVKDLDPAIERAILRTLERESERSSAVWLWRWRPSCRAAIRAAAALAAGETPSTEVVAAAGARTAVKHTHAILGAVVTWRSSSWRGPVAAANYPQSRIGQEISDVLVDRAHQVPGRDSVGNPKRSRATGSFAVDGDLVRYSLEQPDQSPQENCSFAAWRLLFFFRTSPRSLVPLSPVRNISDVDPPVRDFRMTAADAGSRGTLDLFLRCAAAEGRSDA
jgi:serine/threonine protein kinase